VFNASWARWASPKEEAENWIHRPPSLPWRIIPIGPARTTAGLEAVGRLVLELPPLGNKLELLALLAIPLNNGFICEPNVIMAELAVDDTDEDDGRMVLYE